MKYRKIGTWYILITGVCSLVFRHGVNAGAAGRIGALISRVFVAERCGAGTARRGEQRWHRSWLRGQIAVVFVAGQYVRFETVVIGLGCLVSKFILHDDRVHAARIIEIRVQVAKLKMWFPLRCGQIEETRTRRCLGGIAGIANVVQRWRIDYVSSRCVWLGIRYLRPDRALVGIGCLCLAGRRCRVHARMLLQSFCKDGYHLP